MAVRANTGQSPNSVSMLGQRQIRLNGIVLAMGCYAGPTLYRGIGWVCLHCVYQVHRIDAYTDLSAMVVEWIGLHVKDTCLLVLSIIISCTFRILAHKENQYSYVYKISGHVLSKALKQTKAGPQSSETPFLVIILFKW